MKQKASLTNAPFYAWLVWGLSAFFMFYKFVIEVSPSVMSKNLMQAFSIDGAQLGNLAASYFYAYLLMQIPAGLLVDKLGPRRVTSVAIFCCAIGTFVFSEASSFEVAMIGRFLSGAGAAFAAINCLKLVANWFPKNRFAFMAGLMMTVGMLGAVGGQAPLASFINTMDWRQAMKIIGLAGVCFAIIFWFIVRDKAEHHLEVGLMPKKEKILHQLRRIFKSPQTWFLSLYSGLAFAPVSIFGGLWGVSFLQESLKISHEAAAHEVSLIFIGFAIGAPFFGRLSDDLGRRRGVMFWGTLVALVTITLAIYLPNLSPVLAAILLFIFGAAISSFLVCFTMIKEIHPPILAATSIGFMNSFDALFGAFSDPLTGKFLDLNWQGQLDAGARIFPLFAYKYALLTLPVYLLLSLFTLIFIKDTYSKKETYPSTMP